MKESITVDARKCDEQDDEAVHNAVDSVHKSAVTRENLASVVDANCALDASRRKVAEFDYNAADESACKVYERALPLPTAYIVLKERRVAATLNKGGIFVGKKFKYEPEKQGYDHAADKSAYTARNRLFGTDFRAKFLAADHRAKPVGKRVAADDRNEYGKQNRKQRAVFVTHDPRTHKE